VIDAIGEVFGVDTVEEICEIFFNFASSLGEQPYRDFLSRIGVLPDVIDEHIQCLKDAGVNFDSFPT
jgi:hypothetical protein